MNPRSNFSSLYSFVVLGAAALLMPPTVTAVLPVAPSNVQAFVVAADRVYLTWADNSADEAGFQLDIGTVASGTFTPHTLRTSTATETTGTAATRELLSRSDQPAYQLAAGTLYQARVRSYNNLGSGGTLQYSTASATVTFTTLTPATFNMPTGLQVESSQATHIRLKWTDNATTEDGYGYNFAINGVGQAGLYGLTNLNATSADLEDIGPSGTTILPGMTYAIQLWGHRTVNSATSFTGGSTSVNPLVTVTTTAVQTFDAPSNFTGSRSGDAGFQMSWTDNSTTEDVFDIQFREGTTGALSLVEQVPWNVTTTNLGGAVGKPNATYQFQVRASKTSGATTTSTLWVGEPLTITTTFTGPSGLVATAPDDTHVNLAWTDNSNAEGNYEVQYFDSGLNDWQNFNYYAANTTSVTNIATGTPGTIRFRVRATYGSSAEVTSSFSNEATINTFHAPTGLVAAPVVSESAVNLTWVDNSSAESKFQILGRAVGATQWTLLGTTAANATSFGVTNLPPGTALEFAVIAAFTATPNDIESPLSNIVTATTLFNAPTGFTATALDDRRVNLAWTDNSSVETAYIVRCKKSATASYQVCATLAPNSTSFQATAEDSGFNNPFLPNTAYSFQVLAISDSSQTAAATAAATTKDGTNSDLSPPLFVNDAFSHSFVFTEGQGTVTSTSVSGTLPPGLGYDAPTRTISGTPTAHGAFACTLNVQWSSGWTRAYTLHLRPIYRPARPAASGGIAAQTLTLGGTSSASIPLTSLISDLDSESAVRLDIPAADGTPSGRSLTIILNDTATPQTVANFRAYLNNAANGYTNAIFHRLVQGFILQGGAYKSSTAVGAAANAFVTVPKLAAVANEPGISNVTGTIAMAKLPGNPNSATTDFFFNLADNGANLDFQNEGFTVFGRVSASSQALLTGTLNNLPLPPDSGNVNAPNYAVTLDGASTTFTALPTNTTNPTAPSSIDSAKILRINNVAATVPVLAYSVSGNTNAAAVSAVTNATSVQLIALAPGVSSVSVQATDLDGNTLLTPLTFDVTVITTFGAWAGSQGLPVGKDGPADDADGDGDTNLEEFAFLTGPTDESEHTSLSPGTQTVGPDQKGTITFKVRKFTNLIFTVEATPNLVGAVWTPIWTTADGFGAANVVSAVDASDHTLLTVKDTVVIAPAAPRFLRVKINSPP